MNNKEACSKKTALPGILYRLLSREGVQALEAVATEKLEEIRLYAHRYAVVYGGGVCRTSALLLTQKEMDDLLFALCGGSLYAFEETLCQGFLSLSDGIRVGVAGDASVHNGQVRSIRHTKVLVFRLSGTTQVSALPLLNRIRKDKGSILVFAPPGVGKTTLLRAAAREAALPASGMRVAVIDCRGELGPYLSDPSLNLSLLSGYPKHRGMEIAIRTLSPDLILSDEIGSVADAEAVLEASQAGVPLLCTAHGDTVTGLLARPYMESLHRHRAFSCYARLYRQEAQAAFDWFPWERTDFLFQNQDRGG